MVVRHSNASPDPGASAARGELVVGTRGSVLALAQAAIVCDALRRLHPAIAIRLERITTTGDVRGDVPLTQLGRGVFVKEIETALLERRIDLAVHSAKDLPSMLAREFALAAILPRADARDVLVSPFGGVRDLPAGARVGTSSPRRMCLLRGLRPDLELVEIRGNVDTRLRKLANRELEALVLAAAGLIRLGRIDEATEWLDAETFIPSVGQGALAVESRADDAWVLDCVRPLDHPETRAAVLAERAFLAELGAGCRAAAGAYAWTDAENAAVLRIHAFVGTGDGSRVHREHSGPIDRPQALGVAIAHDLLMHGAAPFLAGSHSALAGKVVALTRPADRSGELMTLLRAHGALPLVCPTIAVQLLTELPELDEALRAAPSPRWIAFTSVNAVHAVADRLAATGQTLERGIRVAVVGDATARTAHARLRRPDFVASEASAETLAAELPEVRGGMVLFPRGDLAAETFTNGISARGGTVRDVVVYRTTQGPGVEELAAYARTDELDAVVFASPSAVRFAERAVAVLRASQHRRPVIVCIGPTTGRAAREMGLDVVEATTTSVGGIVETLRHALEADVASHAVSTLTGP